MQAVTKKADPFSNLLQVLRSEIVLLIFLDSFCVMAFVLYTCVFFYLLDKFDPWIYLYLNFASYSHS